MPPQAPTPTPAPAPINPAPAPMPAAPTPPPASPVPPAPGNSGGSWGPLVGIAVIVLLLAAAGLYFFLMQPQPQAPILPNNDTQAVEQQTAPQDSVGAIENDLEATHSQSLEGDVNALEGSF